MWLHQEKYSLNVCFFTISMLHTSTYSYIVELIIFSWNGIICSISWLCVDILIDQGDWHHCNDQWWALCLLPTYILCFSLVHKSNNHGTPTNHIMCGQMFKHSISIFNTATFRCSTPNSIILFTNICGCIGRMTQIAFP